MSKLALVVDGTINEVIPQGGGLAPVSERYHPDFVARLVEVPVDAQPGWSMQNGQFQPPAPLEASSAPRYLPAPLLRERLEAQGKWDAVVGLLTIPQVLKLATLREGVAPDDADMLALLGAAGVDVNAVLVGYGP